MQKTLEMIKTCIEDDDFKALALVEKVSENTYRVAQELDGIERYCLIRIKDDGAVYATWYIAEESDVLCHHFASCGIDYDIQPGYSDVMVIDFYSGIEDIDNEVTKEAKKHKVVFSNLSQEM